VVVREATSKLNLAIGDVVHLFGGEVEIVMMSWIITEVNEGHLEGSGTNMW
jgi:hypothetical protein